MKLPQLNRRLTLEDPLREADGAGGYTQSWVALGRHWAAVQPRTGRAAEREGLSLSRVPHKIIVRATPPGSPSRPKPDQRFRDGERLFLIRAVTEADPDARYLICIADEELLA
jgi:head-tail adaptor